MYHLWCYLPLSQDMFDAFDTPHLEFLQAGMLAITHSERLLFCRWVILAADALATATTLSSIARSQLMRNIHRVLLSVPAFRAYLAPMPRLLPDHWHGVASMAKDAQRLLDAAADGLVRVVRRGRGGTNEAELDDG